MEEIEWTNLFLGIAFTAFMYLLLPIIFRIVYRNKTYSNKEAKEVAIINGVFVYILTFVLSVIIYGEIENVTPALIWGSIGYAILKKGATNMQQETSEIDKNSNASTNNKIEQTQFQSNYQTSYCRECGNKLLDTDKFCSNCGAKILKNVSMQ